MEDQDLTFGEKAVGLTFNPGNNKDVDKCKQAFSNIIDNMHDLRESTHEYEVKRMCSLAIIEAQTAQMWAVKAITWKF